MKYSDSNNAVYSRNQAGFLFGDQTNSRVLWILSCVFRVGLLSSKVGDPFPWWKGFRAFSDMIVPCWVTGVEMLSCGFSQYYPHAVLVFVSGHEQSLASPAFGLYTWLYCTWLHWPHRSNRHFSIQNCVWLKRYGIFPYYLFDIRNVIELHIRAVRTCEIGFQQEHGSWKGCPKDRVLEKDTTHNSGLALHGMQNLSRVLRIQLVWKVSSRFSSICPESV